MPGRQQRELDKSLLGDRSGAFWKCPRSFLKENENPVALFRMQRDFCVAGFRGMRAAVISFPRAVVYNEKDRFIYIGQ